MNNVYDVSTEIIYVQQKEMVCAVKDGTNWARGLIKEVDGNDGVRSVLLVDEGKIVQSDWKDLRYLSNDFMDLPEGVAEFKLSDLEPIEGQEYSQECLDEFSYLCQSDQIEIHIIRLRGSIHEVTMTVFCGDEEVQVNSYFVREGWAISTGIQSHERQNSDEKVENWLMDTKRSQEAKEMTAKSIQREGVKIKHFVSLSEMYIQLDSRTDEIRRLSGDLQHYVDTLRYSGEIDANVEWKVGDHCCIRAELPQSASASMWYRGLVLAVNGTSHTVFLLDEGQTLTHVLIGDLAPIDGALVNVQQGVLRCHLALVNPLARSQSDWIKAASEAFTEYTSRFKGIAVSLDEKNEDGPSHGATFWGRRVVAGGALSSATIDWVNINDYLIEVGLVRPANQHLSLRDRPALPICNQIGPDYNKKQADSLISSLKDLAEREELLKDVKSMGPAVEVVHDLQCWPPALPIRCTTFKANVTYVDPNLFFHLHLCEQKETIDIMKERINEVLSLGEYPTSKVWRIGQPCLAKFADTLFYRAEVVSIDEAQEMCQVQFIDYGDIQACRYEDMKNVVMFDKVPKQATYYYHANFQPAAEDGRWPKYVVDYCYNTTTTKVCSVRINPGYDLDNNSGPVPFEIVPSGEPNMRDFLAMNKWGVYKFPERKIKLSDVKYDDNVKPASITANDALPDVIDLDALQDIEDYQRLFERSVGYEDQKEKFCGDDDDKDYDFFGDWRKETSANKVLGGPGLSDAVSESDLGSTNKSGSFQFEEFDDTVFNRIRKTFKPFVLDKNTTRIYVHIKKYVNPTNFIVSPAEDLENGFQEMVDEIQGAAENLPSLESKVKVNLACLAYSNSRKLWHRALVLEPCATESLFHLVFVDFMEEEDVFGSYIRKCSSKFLVVPIQSIPVTLYNVKRNRRMRTADILRRLEELMPMNTQVFCASIKKGGRVPEVKFYQNGNHSQPVYEPMFAERLLKQILSDNR